MRLSRFWLLLLPLILPALAWGNACQSLATGLWSAPGTWTSCGGTSPQPGDTANISSGHVITKDVAFSVVSVTITGAGSKLQRDTSAGAITTSVTGGPGLSAVNLGTLDLKTNSAFGNEIAITCATTSGQGCIATSFTGSSAAVIRVHHFTIQTGGGYAFNIGDNNSDATVDIGFCKTIGALPGLVFSYNLNNLIVDSCTTDGITGLNTINQTASGGKNWTITNVTDTSTASVGGIVALAGESTGLTMTGNVGYSSNATYERAILNTQFVNPTLAVPSTFSYNIAKSLKGTGIPGIGGCQGVTTAHCVVHHNVVLGFTNAYWWRDYYDSSSNVGTGNTATVPGQGIFFQQGNGGHTTQNNDVGIVDAGSAGNNIGIFWCCGFDADPTDFVGNHLGMFGRVSTGDAAINILVGEGGVGSITTPIKNVSISNSISFQGDSGIISLHPANTFVTSGTGSVGVFNNNSTAAGSGSNWGRTVGDTGYGVSPAHPSATYGDNTDPPWITSTTRRLEDCDRIIAQGPGTAAHLTSVLGLRWNGTNGAVTAQAVYNCMNAPLVSQNIKLATAGAGGTYIGPRKPTGLIGAFMPR